MGFSLLLFIIIVIYHVFILIVECIRVIHTIIGVHSNTRMIMIIVNIRVIILILIILCIFIYKDTLIILII